MGFRDQQPAHGILLPSYDEEASTNNAEASGMQEKFARHPDDPRIDLTTNDVCVI
jgi:hypothetical protein